MNNLKYPDRRMCLWKKSFDALAIYLLLFIDSEISLLHAFCGSCRLLHFWWQSLVEEASCLVDVGSDLQSCLTVSIKAMLLNRQCSRSVQPFLPDWFSTALTDCSENQELKSQKQMFTNLSGSKRVFLFDKKVKRNKRLVRKTRSAIYFTDWRRSGKLSFLCFLLHAGNQCVLPYRVSNFNLVQLLSDPRSDLKLW